MSNNKSNKSKKTLTTSKKTKIVGKQTYINPETGEAVDCQVISVEDRDFNFHKIWLGHIIQALDSIGNQKIKVINFILENMDTHNNQLIMSQRAIAEKSNVSYAIVNQTIKALKEADFIQEVIKGVYQVNPNTIFKGHYSTRMNVMYQYNQVRKEKIKAQEEKENANAPEKKQSNSLEDFEPNFEEALKRLD